jgi:hypothetical protein
VPEEEQAERGLVPHGGGGDCVARHSCLDFSLCRDRDLEGIDDYSHTSTANRV